jgi:hypothetical protein
MNHEETEHTEKTGCGDTGATRWLADRVNHVSDNSSIFSSVFSEPLWFNCGFRLKKRVTTSKSRLGPLAGFTGKYRRLRHESPRTILSRGAFKSARVIFEITV